MSVQNAEFTVKSQLDPKSPMVSINRAKWCAYGGMVSSLITLPFFPVTPTIGVISIIGWGFAIHAIKKRIQTIEKDFRELGEKRGFSFGSNRAPAKRDHNGAIESEKKNPQWTSEWVAFQMALEDDNYNGTEVKRWRKKMFIEADLEKIVNEQAAWVTEHAERRYEIVEKWWNENFIYPLLTKRFGKREFSETEINDASKTMEVELRAGICMAGQPHLWKNKLGVGREVILYKDLCNQLIKDRDENGDIEAPPFPTKKYPTMKYFYLGKGFVWDQKHTQKMEELKMRDLGEVTKNPEEQGDPRIFGVGVKDAENQFIEESQFNQHCGIFGATGVGKTRYVEPLLVQAIQTGFPIIIIDPKGDRALIDRTFEECRRAGRGHQVRYFTLVTPSRPRSYDFLSTYNPCFSYGHYSELASRIGSVVPDTKDPFWKNAAVALASNCMGLCDSAMRYLMFIGRKKTAQGVVRLDRASMEIPKVLLAMRYAKDHTEATPMDAEEAVDAVIAKMQDPKWFPVSPDEKNLVDMMMVKSLGGMPMYSPIEWNPTVRQVSEYEIDNTVPFLGWMLKIIFYHIYLSNERTVPSDYPKICSDKDIVSKSNDGASVSMWSLFQSSRLHPLEVRYTPNAQVTDDNRRWKEFYDYFVPDSEEEHYELKTLFNDLRKLLEGHFSDCVKERQKFLEQATTLSSAIKPFLGEKSKVVCALDPDVTWPDVVAKNQVVYCALGSMVDPVASTNIAKMMVQDIASFVGTIYARNPDKAKGFYLICDEIATFINDPMIDLLNKARGAGLRCILIGQTNADLAKALGSQDAAKMVKGNLNTVVQLRTQLAEDARDFAERTGKVNVVQASRNIGITPNVAKTGSKNIAEYQTNEGRSYSTKEVERVPPAALLNLPRGQAYIHAKGQVFMISQGMFEDPKTFFLQESGMNDGVMVESWIKPSQDGPAGGAPVVTPPTPKNPLDSRTQSSFNTEDQESDVSENKHEVSKSKKNITAEKSAMIDDDMAPIDMTSSDTNHKSGGIGSTRESDVKSKGSHLRDLINSDDEA